MSHMLHKKLVAKKRNAKENKEELKTGGIIIMYVVKKKKEKEGTSGYPKFVTSLARMAFPPSLFPFLFSIKFFLG